MQVYGAFENKMKNDNSHKNERIGNKGGKIIREGFIEEVSIGADFEGIVRFEHTEMGRRSRQYKTLFKRIR